MKTQTTKRFTVAALSCLCLSALVGGVLMPNAHVGAEEDTNVVYAQDFEALAGNAAAETIGRDTSWLGGARSVSVSEGLYVNIPESQITLWYNDGPVLAVGEVYTVSTKFRLNGTFGVMELTGSDDASSSCIQVAPKQTTITAKNVKQWSGTYNFTLVDNVTKTDDGWWDVSFTLTGTGKKNYWRFYVGSAGSGFSLDLAEFKIAKGDETLFSVADKLTPSLKNTVGEPGCYTVYQATKWDVGANGTAMTKIAGIGGKSLKAVYDFEADGTSTAASKVYLDKAAVALEADTQYKVEFDVAPLGNVDEIDLAFEQYAPQGTAAQKTGTVKLTPATFDSAATENTDGFFDLDYEGITYDSRTGVYRVSEVINGSAGNLSVAAGLKAANRMGETGLYLDNITVTKLEKEVPVPVGAALGVKQTTWNKANGEDLSIAALNIEEVASVKFGETVLTADQYALAGGYLTVKASVLDGVDEGNYTLTVTVGKTDFTASVRVIQAPMAGVGDADFETLIDLVEDLSGEFTHRNNNTPFYQNSSFNPGDWDVSISTADFSDGHGRAVRFRPMKRSDCYIFQSNPAIITGMEANKWNRISMDLKPENGATKFRTQVIAFNASPYWDKYVVDITVDIVHGTSGYSNQDVGWSVVPLENGWYRLSVGFYFEETRDCKIYGRFFAAREGDGEGTESSAWIVDNFLAEKELIPGYVRGNGLYDLGADSETYYLLDLCGDVYGIESVKLGQKTLAEGTDYTLPAVPGAYVRLELTDSFRKSYDLGYAGTIMVETTRKNTVLELPFKVTNTQPIVPAAAVSYDVAADLTARKGVSFAADLLGYEFAYISYDGEELLGSEYSYDADAKKLTFKQSYLKGLAAGNHVYTLYSATGAFAPFTLAVSDTRPAFAAAVSYDKRSGGDLVTNLNLYGRDIVSIVLDGKTLTGAEYTCANGKLTVKEAVVSAFIAGEYDLTVTTIVPVTVKLAVTDVPPAFSGTDIKAFQDSDLVLDVNLSDKAIVSVTVGGLPLTEKDYTLENGKLTIKSGVLGELALGEKNVVLRTEGGTAEIAFTLAEGEAPKEDSGCNSAIGFSEIIALASLVLIGAFAVNATAKKKKN